MSEGAPERRATFAVFVTIAAITGLVTLAGLVWVRPGAIAARPDILLVTIDTLRADHSSAYGYTRPTTPHLDALARGGGRVEDAYAPMATTTPSHATMFTGWLPRAHGVLKNGHALSPVYATVAEALRAQGYRTAAFVSSFPLDRRFGLARGFSRYDDDFRGARASMAPGRWEGHDVRTPFDRPADVTIARVEQALDRLLAPPASPASRAAPARRSLFLWVHLFDPHAPYTPPPRTRFSAGADVSPLERSIAAYDGEIRFADEQLGRLVDALAARGVLDDMLVVVAGDHGEGLMQHGHMEHGLQIYEEAVKVPLVFHWPARLPPGRTVSGPVQLADLAPTLLELAGLPHAAFEHDGKSVAAALLTGAPIDAERPIFLQRRYYESGNDAGVEVRGDKVGVRVGTWKYIRADLEASFELFDLATDPDERQNVLASNPQIANVLATTLDGWLQRPAARPAGAVTDDVAERLRALGYVR